MQCQAATGETRLRVRGMKLHATGFRKVAVVEPHVKEPTAGSLRAPRLNKPAAGSRREASGPSSKPTTREREARTHATVV